MASISGGAATGGAATGGAATGGAATGGAMSAAAAAALAAAAGTPTMEEIVRSTTVSSPDLSRKTNEARVLDMGHDYASSIRVPLDSTGTLEDGVKSMPDGVSWGPTFKIPSDPDIIHVLLRQLRDDDEIRPTSQEDPIDNKYLLASDSRYGGEYTNINRVLQDYNINYFMIDAMKGNAFTEGLKIQSGINVVSVPTYLDGGIKMRAAGIKASLPLSVSLNVSDRLVDPTNTYTTYHLFKNIEYIMTYGKAYPHGKNSIQIKNIPTSAAASAAASSSSSSSPEITVYSDGTFPLNGICKALRIPEPRKTKGGTKSVILFSSPPTDLLTKTKVAAIKTLGDWSQLYRVIDLQNYLRSTPVLLITNDKFFLDICVLFLRGGFKPSFVLLTDKINKLYCFDNEKLKEDSLYPRIWEKIKGPFVSTSAMEKLDELRTLAATKINHIMSLCNVDTLLGYFIWRDLKKLLEKINSYLNKFEGDFVDDSGALKEVDPTKPEGRELLKKYKELAIKPLEVHINDMLKESFNIIETYNSVPGLITGAIRPYVPERGVEPDMGTLDDDGRIYCARDMFELLEETFTDLTNHQKGFVYYYMIPNIKKHLDKFASYRNGQVNYLSENATLVEVLDGFNFAHKRNDTRHSSKARSVSKPVYYESLTYSFYSLMNPSAADIAAAAAAPAAAAAAATATAAAPAPASASSSSDPAGIIHDLEGLSAFTKCYLDPEIRSRTTEVYSTLMRYTPVVPPSAPAPAPAAAAAAAPAAVCPVSLSPSDVISDECLHLLATKQIIEGKMRYNLLSNLVKSPKETEANQRYWAPIYQGRAPQPPITLAQVIAENKAVALAAAAAAATAPRGGGSAATSRPRSRSRGAVAVAAVAGGKRSRDVFERAAAAAATGGASTTGGEILEAAAATDGASTTAKPPKDKRARKNSSGNNMEGGYRQHGGGNTNTDTIPLELDANSIETDTNPKLTRYEMTKKSLNYTKTLKILGGYYQLKDQNPTLTDENSFLEFFWEMFSKKEINDATDFYAYLLEMISYLDDHASESGVLFEFRADLAKFAALIDYDDTKDNYNEHDFLFQVAYHLFSSEYLSYVFLNSISTKLLNSIITKFLEIETQLADSIGILAIIDLDEDIQKKFKVYKDTPTEADGVATAPAPASVVEIPGSGGVAAAPAKNSGTTGGSPAASVGKIPGSGGVAAAPAKISETPRVSPAAAPVAQIYITPSHSSAASGINPTQGGGNIIPKRLILGGARRRSTAGRRRHSTAHRQTRRFRTRQQRRTRRGKRSRQTRSQPRHKTDMPIAE